MNASGNIAAKLPTAVLESSRRLIVKIGSSLLVNNDTGALHQAWLDALCDDIAELQRGGRDVIIVTSGAIAIGRGPLGMRGRKLRLEEKQAAAATGQMRLTQAYQTSLDRHKLIVSQVLVTLDDTENRRRYLNARNTLDTLLKLRAVPVINENDTVATAELRFGDNDRLAARVAQMISADTLVLLSDIDGLYTADPRYDTNATFVPEVRDVTPEIEAMAGGTNLGVGGMVTKIIAAKICLQAGCRMAIAPGKPSRPLRVLNNGGRCTWFIPAAEPRAARKRWIAGSIQPSGVLVVDDGAVSALEQRQEPSASGRGRCRRRLRARRCGRCARRRWPHHWPWLIRLRRRGCSPDQGPAIRRDRGHPRFPGPQ